MITRGSVRNHAIKSIGWDSMKWTQRRRKVRKTGEHKVIYMRIYSDQEGQAQSRISLPGSPFTRNGKQRSKIKITTSE
jgi:hypothetical protein